MGVPGATRDPAPRAPGNRPGGTAGLDLRRPERSMT